MQQNLAFLFPVVVKGVVIAVVVIGLLITLLGITRLLGSRRWLKAQFIAAPSSRARQIAPPDDWRSTLFENYQRTRHYMLAHICSRTTEPGHDFEVSIFVVRHQKGERGSPPPQIAGFDDIEKAEFFFGDSWENEIFPVINEKGILGVTTRVWGSFPAICRLTFTDKTNVIIERFIDLFSDSSTWSEALSAWLPESSTYSSIRSLSLTGLPKAPRRQVAEAGSGGSFISNVRR